MQKLEPKGYVIFFNKKEPVTWERETRRYVYNVKRLQKENNKWVVNRRIFDEKMDKEEIFNGVFQQEYIPLRKLREQLQQ